jgi:uncharacterized membrane protein YedE/YeeE
MAAGALAGALTLYLFPPEDNPFYPQCPIFRLTHLYCPGCGATRALAALLHGRVVEALHYNALLVLLLPFLLGYFAIVYWHAVKQNRWVWPPLRTSTLIWLLVIAAGFTILRNVMPVSI